MKRMLVGFVFFSGFLGGFSGAQAQNTYGKSLCQLSKTDEYECYTVKKGDTWQKLFPNEQERDLVRRLNRTNQEMQRGTIVALPKQGAQLSYAAITPFPARIQSNGQKEMIFDPTKLAWAAYDANGDLIKWGPASGGNTWCADVKRSCRTAQGQFEIYRKQGESCRSAKYPLPRGGAPMPYCMHFHKGFAFHGSPTVPGYNASHGCVRLFTEDAKWLNEKFVNVKEANQRVKVKVLPYGNSFNHTEDDQNKS